MPVPGNETTRAIRGLLKQAESARDAGDHELGGRLLERCIELDDGTDADVSGDADRPPFRLRPYMILAENLLQRGDAGRALALLTRALERWPGDPDLHMLLGQSYAARDDWEHAVQSYRRSFDLDQRAYVCILLASALDKLQRPHEAWWWLRHSLVVDPDYEESHYNLGCLDVRRGDNDAADQHFRRALELDPAYADAHRELGALLLARARTAPAPTAHQDWRPAFEHLSRATELAPDDDRSRSLLAAMRE